MTDGWCKTCKGMTEKYSMIDCAKCRGGYKMNKNGGYDCSRHGNDDWRTKIIYKQTRNKNGVVAWAKA